eukprot:3931610-Rhodomonas_salina.2
MVEALQMMVARSAPLSAYARRGRARLTEEKNSREKEEIATLRERSKGGKEGGKGSEEAVRTQDAPDAEKWRREEERRERRREEERMETARREVEEWKKRAEEWREREERGRGERARGEEELWEERERGKELELKLAEAKRERDCLSAQHRGGLTAPSFKQEPQARQEGEGGSKVDLPCGVGAGGAFGKEGKGEYCGNCRRGQEQ